MKRMNVALSKEAKELLSYIIRYIEENGYQPSRIEMAAQFEVSNNAITTRLHSLERRGYLTLDGASNRSIKLTGVRWRPIRDREAIDRHFELCKRKARVKC